MGKIMKKQVRKYFLLSLLILLISILACHDVEIVTYILPNGSVLRSISMPGDSTKAYDSAYPLLSDTSGQVVKTRKKDVKEFGYTVTKFYQNASEINNEFASLPDTVLYIRPVVKLEKRFRWFYTFFSYHETYKAHGLQFLNSDSLLVKKVKDAIAERDSTSEKDESEDIEEELIFEDLYQTILRAAEEINDPGLRPQIIREKKQNLHDSLMAADVDFDRFVNDVLKTCADIYQTHSVIKLKPFIEEFNKKLKRYLDFIERSIGETYKNSVVMPGVVIATNSHNVHGNKVAWEVDTDNFQLEDYQMWVESRRMNVLPTVFTGLFLLGCIAGILLITRKMKREKAGLNEMSGPHKSKPMNKWISVLFVISGVALFLFFGWLAVIYWNFGFLTIQFISMKEKILFIFLSLLGLVLLIIGIKSLLQRRLKKKSEPI